MNIFLFELRAQLKSFLIWAASLLVVLFLFMSMYATFSAARESVERVYAGFPPGFAEAFAINIKLMFSYGGFYQFIYTYLAVIGAIMASSLSIATFSREKRNKCVDFLLAKPLSRGAVFGWKLLSGVVLLLGVNVLYLAAIAIAYGNNAQDPAGLGQFLWASCSMLFTQLVFYSFGVLYATLAKKVRSVSGIATAFGFGGFILSALYGLLKEDALIYVAPLKYFEPIKALTGGFPADLAITGAALAVLCVAVSYVRYRTMDAAAA